jgi:hypothetical protein
MTKRIAILLMSIGMSIGLASRVTALALAQTQGDKMQSDDKMKDDKMQGDDKMKDGKMAGDQMAGHDKMAKKKKKAARKDKMSGDKMSNQDKMDHPQQ